MAKAKASTDPRVDALADIVCQLLTHASFPMLSGDAVDALRARAAEIAGESTDTEPAPAEPVEEPAA